MKSVLLALPALLALAACDNGIQSADKTAAEAAAEGDLAANSSVAPTPTPSASASRPVVTQIPAAIRGRWGLNAADCERGRSDAKGLLTITGDKLEFYESVGTLGKVAEADADSIRATFDFEGEGMTWQRDVLLEVENDGTALRRREYGPDAAPEPFRYAKCNRGR